MKKFVLLICSALTGIICWWVTTDSGHVCAQQQHNLSVQKSQFETAVEIIKKYEGMHSPRHWPLVGYGHKVLPGEKFARRTLSEKEADALLRKDLLKNCAVFRSYGKDSLLLGVLAYNIGSGNVKRSSVTANLRNGNRDIRNNYLAHSRYKGKTLSQLQRRRAEEFEKLFIAETFTDSLRHSANGIDPAILIAAPSPAR